MTQKLPLSMFICDADIPSEEYFKLRGPEPQPITRRRRPSRGFSDQSRSSSPETLGSLANHIAASRGARRPPRQSGRWAPGGNQWALPWGFEAPRPHKATTTKGKKGVGRVLVFLNDIFPHRRPIPIAHCYFCMYILAPTNVLILPVIAGVGWGCL